MRSSIKALLIHLHLLNPSRFLLNYITSFSPKNREKQKRQYELIHFYEQFIQPNDICFDIGAHVGSRTRVFLLLKASLVVAVEPNPKCIESMQRKFQGNKHVDIIQKGLGESIGTAQFWISSFPKMSSMSPEWIKVVGKKWDYTWDTSITVEITTLDALIEQFGEPHFCKIDVEGFELEVLKGLSCPLKNLSFEYNPRFLETTKACISYLEGLGTYEYNYSVAEYLELAISEWVSSQELSEILSDPSIPDWSGDIYARLRRRPNAK
jgi:FkbM family methyltransferase